MSAIPAPTAARVTALRDVRPRFFGLLRGELRKIAHMRITWIMGALFTLFIVGSQLVLASGPGTADQLRRDPLGAFYNVLQGDLSLLRMFGGVFLLILAANVVGLEYQHGTIRILLGRGVGRLLLLGAKSLALTLAGLALLLWGLLIEAAFAVGIILTLANGQRPWEALGGEFWTDLTLYLLCVLISMGVTLLLGVAASALGRSLAMGLAVGLSWFAVDNLLTIPLTVLYQFTHAEIWRQLSGYLLGLMLNRLPDYLIPAYHVTAQGPAGPVSVARPVDGFGVMPLVPVDATHALLVILAYALIFAAAAILPTWRRDVLE